MIWGQSANLIMVAGGVSSICIVGEWTGSVGAMLAVGVAAFLGIWLFHYLVYGYGGINMVPVFLVLAFSLMYFSQSYDPEGGGPAEYLGLHRLLQ